LPTLLGPLAGGNIACRFCGTQNQVSVRDDRPMFNVDYQAPQNETERIERLRSQDGRPFVPPSGLQDLVPHGQIVPWKVQEVVVVWQQARHEVATNGSFDAAEQLLFLTVALSNYFGDQRDEVRERAMV